MYELTIETRGKKKNTIFSMFRIKLRQCHFVVQIKVKFERLELSVVTGMDFDKTVDDANHIVVLKIQCPSFFFVVIKLLE